MLFLVFEIGQERYCLEVSHIIEITPMVIFKKIPHAPAYFAGLFNYRGTAVPVIDLSMLLSGKPSRPLFSTRIVVVDYTGVDKAHRILGLLAERATEMISCREDDFQPPGIGVDEARYLGDVIFDERGMIQKIGINELPTETIRGYQFASMKENNDIILS